jgi:hypothetical protein
LFENENGGLMGGVAVVVDGDDVEGVRGKWEEEVTDERKMCALGLAFPFIKKMWSDGGSLSSGEGA